MTADTLAADLLVLALSNAWLLLLAVPAFALGAALTWWRQRRRSAPAVHAAAALSIRVAELELALALAEERLTAELERDNAEVYRREMYDIPDAARPDLELEPGTRAEGYSL